MSDDLGQLKAELQQVEQALAVAETLPAAQRQVLVAALQAQRAALQTQITTLSGSGALAQQDSVAASSKGVAVGGGVEGGIHVTNIYQDTQVGTPLHPNIQPALPVPKFIIPFQRNDGFVGRETELKKLDAALINPSGARPVVVVGLGGIGKTQLVVEYAYRFMSDYPNGVYWVSADKEWQAELASLAEQIGLRADESPQSERCQRLALAFLHFLNACPKSLLIFDNVEDPRALYGALESSLNRMPLQCRLIFTTQHYDGTGMLFTCIQVKALPEPDALRLLLQAETRQDVLQRYLAKKTDPEVNAARAICCSLGYLSLALALAAAYLGKYPRISLDGYLRRLRRDGGLATIDATEVDPLDLPTRHIAAMKATLKLQWDRLNDADARCVFQTAGMLRVAAPIPRARLALLAGLPDEADEGYATPLDEALTTLRSFSFIEDVTGPEIHLSPLVHEFARLLTPGKERTSLQKQLETNAIKALKDRTHRYGRALVAGECMLDLEWVPTKMRPAVIEALRELMCDENAALKNRRTAAFLLIRLQWLDDPIWRRAEDLQSCLELTVRSIDLPVQLAYLVEGISLILETQVPDRQQAHLLTHRAKLRGQFYESLGEIERDRPESKQLIIGAKQDYVAAKRIVTKLIHSQDRQKEDYRLLARINLGAGNIAREARAWAKADRSYGAAARAARTYKQDPGLEIGTCTERSRNYALLQKWGKAEKQYQTALAILATWNKDKDPETYARLYFLVQNNAGLVHWKKGQYLASEPSQALVEYTIASQLMLETIETLERYIGESEDLVLAHINAGDYLLAMYEFPQCHTGEVLNKACGHWQSARNIAHRWGMWNLEREANTRLEQHCPNKQGGSGN